jgi:two-component system sensor histidine kinase/response regulator
MARILIVDDQAIDRQFLTACLAGHEIIEADSADLALKLAAERPPDLVLLDVMGGIDGIETTRRLKRQSEGYGFMPIILLTAQADRDARVRGLEAGADEWLSTPVDRQELELRMRNLLALRDREQSLARRNLALLELDRFRQEMSELLVHDLKNPLAVIAMNHDYLAAGLRHLDHSFGMALEDSILAVRRMNELLKNLLDMARLEARRFDLRCTPTNVGRLIRSLAEQRRITAQANSIVLEVESQPDDLHVLVDPDLLTRALENIIDNAFRYTPREGRITVLVHRLGGKVEIRVGNSGTAIPGEARQAIFEKFGQTRHAGRMNLGLGLYFCRLVAEAHGGQIYVEETEQLPTVFVIDLPQAA